ncbi:MAG: aldo/keto reductase [Sulfobacillus benefaciens]|uniref:Aldo/keto reductase n=1 Tax=Sulfobacillus benefaciens TaxID=453960 RepID=A0A2T2WVA7_9FIRM|nr:MAG: aldo/keto reductase [Sulfobacillus benefaciens]
MEILQCRLGSSDRFVSAIGLGTWQFSQGHGLIGKFWPSLDNNTIREIVKAAHSGGINWFDTAEAYGRGQSEYALSQALNDLQIPHNDALIATKWWPLLRSSRSLESTIHERLQRLQGWPITLYQIHQPYSTSSIADQMTSMARLLDLGLIQQAGVSNFSASQMTAAYRALKAHGHTLSSNQVRFNLLDRRIETNGVLSAAQDLGMTIIAYSPLAQGLLTGKFHNGSTSLKGFRRFTPQFSSRGLAKTSSLIHVLDTLAAKYQVTMAEVALNWLITTPGQFVTAIAGATSQAQASQNAHAMTWKLTASDRSALDQVF